MNGETENPKPCHTCNHRRFRVERKQRGSVGVWGCDVKKLRFGYQWEFNEGNNMPDKCDKEPICPPR